MSNKYITLENLQKYNEKVQSRIDESACKTIEYDVSATYTAGTVVHYDGYLYTPRVKAVTGIPPTDATNWKPLACSSIEVVRLL